MDSRLYIVGRDSIPQFVSLGAGESLNWTLAVLPGTSCDLHIEIDLDGPGAEADLAGLYLCNDNEDVNISVLLKHNCGGCESRQLFKGIVGGTARAGFCGLIYVAPDAGGTKAVQESHSILLSVTARAETRPQLEIHTDDVECSHGATTGYLDAEQLFYLRSRGIPEDEARDLQIKAFLAPVTGRSEALQKLVG